MPYLIKQVIRTGTVHTVKEYDPLSQVILMFDDQGISAMPVRNSLGDIIGVVSKSDLARRRLLVALQRGESPDKIFVKDFMNRRKPVTVNLDQPVKEAVRLMHRFSIHRVFVQDARGELCGVLSSTDIIRMLRVEEKHRAQI